MKIKLTGEKWGHLGDYKIGDVVDAKITRIVLDPKGDGTREIDIRVGEPGWGFDMLEVDTVKFYEKGKDLGTITIPENVKYVKFEMERRHVRNDGHSYSNDDRGSGGIEQGAGRPSTNAHHHYESLP